ncbi:MAG: reverse transcriptase domain-containing protein [Gloeomargaritales cyanobacterium]
MTYKVLLSDTDQIVKRSVLRSAETAGIEENARLEAKVKDLFESPASVDPAAARATLQVDPKDLVGYRFIKDFRGDPFAARVVEHLEDGRYRVELGDGDREEIMVYNDLVQLADRRITDDPDDGERVWIYDDISDHRPIRGRSNQWEVLVKWATGEQSWEPLSVIHSTDPVTLAKYAKENNLLDKDGWKRYRAMCKDEKRYVRMLRQATLQKARAATNGDNRTKYGVKVPRNEKEAIELDKKNGNTKWQDSIKQEMDMIAEYKTFRDYGNAKSVEPPAGYKKIRTHLVFDVKFDLRRKARLVAGGHTTDPPKESVYSGVASMRSIRMCLFLAELNGLEACAADVGNAYLEANTKEKLFIVAGSEFGPLAGHILIFNKALYGLRTSGARWHEKLADVLRNLGWTPSYADPDVWMKDCGDHYEYICVYVDDLIAAGLKPMEIIADLRKIFKLKGVGPPSYFLGMDFKRGDDGVLALGSETYIKKILDSFGEQFGEKPQKNVTTPLDPSDRQELDLSEELGETGIQLFQSLIGQLQWAVTLGRLDIYCAVMTMSKFRVAPRKGHLDSLKRVYAYLRNYKRAIIKFKVNIPGHEHSQAPMMEYDWEHVYGKCYEELPANMPKPKGKFVRTSTFVDANLLHDMVTGRSCTGALHFLNQTPIDWNCKRQNTVETATYGVAARVGTDQIVHTPNARSIH